MWTHTSPTLPALLCLSALQHGDGSSGCRFGLRRPRAAPQPLPALQHLLLLIFLSAVPRPIRSVLGHNADCADQRGEQLGQHQQPGLVQQPPWHSLHTLVFTLGLTLLTHTPRGGGRSEWCWSSSSSYLRRDTWCYIFGLTREESRLHFGSSYDPVINFVTAGYSFDPETRLAPSHQTQNVSGVIRQDCLKKSTNIMTAPFLDWPENSAESSLKGVSCGHCVGKLTSDQKPVQHVNPRYCYTGFNPGTNSKDATWAKTQRRKALFYKNEEWHRVQRTKYIFLFYFCMLNRDIFSVVSCFNRCF